MIIKKILLSFGLLWYYLFKVYIDFKKYAKEVNFDE